ncbi:MAG: cation:proton antiporter, partial [Candidatus Woesearchaeota archaeon]|nr:cation:proton antiporter [Candidatus Woesearchaeota archaeon]
MDIFFQIGIMFIVSALIALIARLIKQPVIPAYILAGVLIGPVLGIITNSDVITTLSSIGMAFLLFVVGLELNLSKIKDTGLFTVIGGTMQVLLIFIVGFIASMLLGLTRLESVYIGFIVAFSSTMIVVKLLSDRREIDTLHGRIIIGILLVQDIIALFVFSVLITKNGFNAVDVMLSIAKGVAVFLIA